MDIAVNESPWKPGDVALVQNEYDVWNTAILQVQPQGPRWVYGVAYASAPTDAPVRSLFVADPEDDLQVDALRAAIAAQPMTQNVAGSAVQAALRSLATDPKPPEPQGLGAVVLAHCGGGNRELLTRFCTGGGGDRTWVDQDGHHHAWADLREVEVQNAGWSE